jgi:hypothetical protein
MMLISFRLMGIVVFLDRSERQSRPGNSQKLLLYIVWLIQALW